MLPTITYPAELPVSGQREEIARAIRDHQVVIVAGATGSGKTTQLPKICLELGRASIAHTQPRRIAARTIAERISEELGVELGGLVGYQVRFTDRVSESTRIKVMTDGILLNEIHRDRELRRYDTIIIDEAHERSLNVDFLLGYLKRLLPRRPDLKVIVTSATIDPESFARHFADASGEPAPVIEVSGRTYPVEVRYRPLVAEAGAGGGGEDSDDEGAAAEDKDVQRGILDALDELERESSGDVLVFLSGESEIRDAEAAVRAHATRRGGAGPDRGAPPLRPALLRRPAPGVRAVEGGGAAPPGRARHQRRRDEPDRAGHPLRRRRGHRAHQPVLRAVEGAAPADRGDLAGVGATSARVAPAARATASRSGSTRRRTTSGGPSSPIPRSCARTSRRSSCRWRRSDSAQIEEFPFLTPPDSRGIRDGLDLLRELGALDDGAAGDGPQLTRIGRQLARLPIEPRFARMVLESKAQGVSREVLAIVAGLTIQDPRERPLERREQADGFHARFVDPTSDFLTLLNLWNHLEEQQRQLSGSAFRRMCKAEFLNYLRVREWQDLYRQLVRLAKPLGLHVAERAGEPNADGIHRALLAGLLSQIGLRDDAKTSSGRGGAGAARETERRGRRQQAEFVGARNTRFVVFPGSALAKKPPGRAHERRARRDEPAVRPDERGHRSRVGRAAGRTARQAHASANRGGNVGRASAVADEKVTLFGVPIVAKRRIQLGRVDQVLARELFIRHALVEEDWDTSSLDRRLFGFVRANRALRRELGEVEERTRRRDILAGDEAVVAFYEARVPADVADTRAFERWWRGEHRRRPDLLTMTARRPARRRGATTIAATDSPTAGDRPTRRYSLAYRFEPGADDDGVTRDRAARAAPPRARPTDSTGRCPACATSSSPRCCARCRRCSAARWCPRPSGPRRSPPSCPTARSAARNASRSPRCVAHAIRRLTFAPVDPSDFDLERVPAHLRATFRAVDERGRTVGDVEGPRRPAGAAGRPHARCGGEGRHRDHARRGQGRPGRPRPGTTRCCRTRRRRGIRPADVGPALVERSGITTWEWDELPAHVDTRQAGNVIRAYPALVDEKTSVALRLVATAEERDRASRRGIRRLLVLATPTPVAYVQEHLSNEEKLALAASAYPGRARCSTTASRPASTRSCGHGIPTGCCARAPNSRRCATRSARASWSGCSRRSRSSPASSAPHARPTARSRARRASS